MNLTNITTTSNFKLNQALLAESLFRKASTALYREQFKAAAVSYRKQIYVSLIAYQALA